LGEFYKAKAMDSDEEEGANIEIIEEVVPEKQE
jgi:hypothetical protein